MWQWSHTCGSWFVLLMLIFRVAGRLLWGVSVDDKNVMQCFFVLGSSSFVVFRETIMSIAVVTACLLKGMMVLPLSFVWNLHEAKHNMQEIFSYDNAMQLVCVSRTISLCNCAFWGEKTWMCRKWNVYVWNPVGLKTKVTKLLLHFFHLYKYWCFLCTDFYISDDIQMCKNSVLICSADEMQVCSMFFLNVCLVKIEVLQDYTPCLWVSILQHLK
jgi:hypothetical protein